MNLIEGLQSEMNRVREIIKEYEDPILKGAGKFASAMMEISIQAAEAAIATGDPIDMMAALTELQEYSR